MEDNKQRTIPAHCRPEMATNNGLYLDDDRKTWIARDNGTMDLSHNYRLDIACRILMQNVGNRNISEIAFKVGFNDPKYFTRCFTKHYGVSPSAYNGERPSESHTPAQRQARP